MCSSDLPVHGLEKYRPLRASGVLGLKKQQVAGIFDQAFGIARGGCNIGDIPVRGGVGIEREIDARNQTLVCDEIVSSRNVDSDDPGPRLGGTQHE